MNNLWAKINNDLVIAMKNKQAFETSVLRMLISAVNYKKIALGKGGGIETLNDEEIIDVIAGEIKKRKDAVEAYQSGGRTDLADKEKAEVVVLEKYLPAQLTDERLAGIVQEVIGRMGPVTAKDTGKIIGQLMPQVRGRADGGRVSAIVKKLLG